METPRTVGPESSPDEAAKETVRTIVGEVLEKSADWLVGRITTEVQKEAGEKVRVLRANYGNRIRGLAGGIMKEAESYAETRKKILDPEAKVSNIGERLGAAGLNSKDDNSVTYDKAAMKYDLDDPEYRKRVAKHERIHQEDQAAFYNEETVSYVDGQNRMQTVEVYSTLVEWQPITEANKPEDLTPAYKGHKEKGDAFIEAVGGDAKARLISALKNGDMKQFQKDIWRKQKGKILELHRAGKINAAEMN